MKDKKSSVDANEKRLKALREKSLLAKERQATISNSLKQVDVQITNKVIKFTAEDENEKEVDRIDLNSKNVSTHKLFEDDDDDVVADESHFKIAPHHKNRQGQKLLELQSKYGGDTRFKLTEQFLDVDDLATDTKDQNLDNDASFKRDEEITKEKSRHINILENVLGKTIKSVRKFESTDDQSSVKKTKLQPNGLMIRFDPDNPAHYRYKRSAVEVANRDKEKRDEKVNLQNAEKLLEKLDIGASDAVVNGELGDNVISKHEIDPDFAKRLKEKETFAAKEQEAESFSLLASLGRKDVKVENQPSTSALHKESDATSEVKLRKWQMSLTDAKRRLLDSSDSEIEKEQDRKLPVGIKSSPDTKQRVAPAGKFFFYLDENLLKDSEKFCRTEKEEVIKAKWAKRRPFLINDYKKRRKHVIRNEKKISKFREERRFRKTQNRKSNKPAASCDENEQQAKIPVE